MVLTLSCSLSRDLLGSQPLADHLEYFHFPIGQGLYGIRFRRFARDIVHKAVCHPRGQVYFPAQYLSDGVEHFVGGLIFGYVTQGPGTQRTLREKHFILHRRNQHFYVCMLGLDLLDKSQALTAFKRDIDNGQRQGNWFRCA